MSSNFLHCETSTFSNNTVYSAVGLKPFDAGWVGYPGFTSGSGTNVCVTNNVPTDWRYIPGSGGWPNTISVKGNVDWAITGYSVVGHIYLYSNQNFMTVTPTMTPSPTATMTSTPTALPTYTATIAPTATVGAWYTGNSRTGAYGVKAVISAPPQAPYLESYIGPDGRELSGESSWVSIPGPMPWVQVGWKYYYNYPSAPKKYLEWYLPNIPPGESKYHGFHYFGNQGWGTTEEYYIIWGGGTIWCGQIGSNYLECFDTEQKYAPITVLAYSEVHASSNNELNAYFSQVYFLSSNNWELFDQAHWRADNPYSVDQIQDYEYRNYGP